MREKLIRALEQQRARKAKERFEQMTDEELEAVIAAELGLPPGVRFTDEQLEMIGRAMSITAPETGR